MPLWSLLVARRRSQLRGDWRWSRWRTRRALCNVSPIQPQLWQRRSIPAVPASCCVTATLQHGALTRERKRRWVDRLARTVMRFHGRVRCRIAGPSCFRFQLFSVCLSWTRLVLSLAQMLPLLTVETATTTLERWHTIRLKQTTGALVWRGGRCAGVGLTALFSAHTAVLVRLNDEQRRVVCARQCDGAGRGR